VRQALIDSGVSFSYDIEEERTWEKATNAGGVLFFCGLKIRGDFRDAETGEVISGRAIGWGADSLDKAPYKAMTGALKYLLRMNFLIPDEQDPEGDNEHYDPKDDLKPVPSVAARQNVQTPQPQPVAVHSAAACSRQDHQRSAAETILGNRKGQQPRQRRYGADRKVIRLQRYS
jgi:hypothetical protein